MLCNTHGLEVVCEVMIRPVPDTKPSVRLVSWHNSMKYFIITREDEFVKNRNVSGGFQAAGTELRLPGLPPEQCSEGLRWCEYLSIKYVQEVYVCVC